MVARPGRLARPEDPNSVAHAPLVIADGGHPDLHVHSPLMTEGSSPRSSLITRRHSYRLGLYMYASDAWGSDVSKPRVVHTFPPAKFLVFG